MELKKVEVAYKDIVLPGGGANEEFLAALRDRLKKMEENGQKAMLVPAVEAGACKDTDAALELTAAYKHCARRVKDCQSVVGFESPAVFSGMERGEELSENFKAELLEKHPHYVFNRSR